jgi:hypothetical protein
MIPPALAQLRRATRAVGGHDLNAFVLRADPVEPNALQPGMSVWLKPAGRTMQ